MVDGLSWVDFVPWRSRLFGMVTRALGNLPLQQFGPMRDCHELSWLPLQLICQFHTDLQVSVQSEEIGFGGP